MRLFPIGLGIAAGIAICQIAISEPSMAAAATNGVRYSAEGCRSQALTAGVPEPSKLTWRNPDPTYDSILACPVITADADMPHSKVDSVLLDLNDQRTDTGISAKLCQVGSGVTSCSSSSNSTSAGTFGHTMLSLTDFSGWAVIGFDLNFEFFISVTLPKDTSQPSDIEGYFVHYTY